MGWVAVSAKTRKKTKQTMVPCSVSELTAAHTA